MKFVRFLYSVNCLSSKTSDEVLTKNKYELFASLTEENPVLFFLTYTVSMFLVSSFFN